MPQEEWELPPIEDTQEDFSPERLEELNQPPSSSLAEKLWRHIKNSTDTGAQRSVLQFFLCRCYIERAEAEKLGMQNGQQGRLNSTFKEKYAGFRIRSEFGVRPVARSKGVVSRRKVAIGYYIEEVDDGVNIYDEGIKAEIDRIRPKIKEVICNLDVIEAGLNQIEAEVNENPTGASESADRILNEYKDVLPPSIDSKIKAIKKRASDLLEGGNYIHDPYKTKPVKEVLNDLETLFNSYPEEGISHGINGEIFTALRTLKGRVGKFTEEEVRRFEQILLKINSDKRTPSFTFSPTKEWMERQKDEQLRSSVSQRPLGTLGRFRQPAFQPPRIEEESSFFAAKYKTDKVPRQEASLSGPIRTDLGTRISEVNNAVSSLLLQNPSDIAEGRIAGMYRNYGTVLQLGSVAEPKLNQKLQAVKALWMELMRKIDAR